MKNILVLFVTLLAAVLLHAQPPPPPPPPTFLGIKDTFCVVKGKLDVHYSNPGIAPQFTGGDTALLQFVLKNFTLDKTQQRKADGVYCRIEFIVDTNGHVCNVRVLRKSGASEETDRKAAQLVCSMPAWIPGGLSDDGVTVSKRLNFAIQGEFRYASISNDTTAYLKLLPIPIIYDYRPATAVEPILNYADVMPSFDGDFQRYLSKTIHYPVKEMAAGKQGTVFIEFVVETDGSLSNVCVVKEVENAPGLAEEALRVIRMMPKGSQVKIRASLSVSGSLSRSAFH